MLKRDVCISALKTAYDEKSLFPSYIREFETKMKQYHSQAMASLQVQKHIVVCPRQ